MKEDKILNHDPLRETEELAPEPCDNVPLPVRERSFAVGSVVPKDLLDVMF